MGRSCSICLLSALSRIQTPCIRLCSHLQTYVIKRLTISHKAQDAERSFFSMRFTLLRWGEIDRMR